MAPIAASPWSQGDVTGASNDPDTVSRWWKAHPKANVALACGPLSGVLALDIDRKGGVDGFAALEALEAEFEPLPATLASQTPSGGRHLLFAYPEGVRPANRVGLKRYGPKGNVSVLHGLDVRGDGASICLPPSRKPGGLYQWRQRPSVEVLEAVPAWLLDLMLSEPTRRPVAPPMRLQNLDRTARYVCAAIDGECGDLARMKPGTGRNHRLFIASARLGELVGAGLLDRAIAEASLERAAYDCGLVTEDGLRAVRATVSSGLKRGEAKPREVA